MAVEFDGATTCWYYYRHLVRGYGHIVVLLSLQLLNQADGSEDAKHMLRPPIFSLTKGYSHGMPKLIVYKVD
jgi:hypothetical protein